MGRGPWLPVAVAVALCAAAAALSTCRSVDLEAARRRRIEAVRGQILSKLRLAAPPEAPGGDAALLPLPPAVAALYNATRDAPAPARDRDRPDDYYAHEVHRLDMAPASPQGAGAANASVRGAQGSYELRFDAAALRMALGPELLLHGAELRMLRKPYTALGHAAQRVELYQKFGAGPWRYVETREVVLGPEPQWLAFDVTDALRFWLAGHESWGFFKLSPHCSCEDDHSAAEILFQIDGFETFRGDMGKVKMQGQRLPFLLATATPPERAAQLQSPRHRRAAADTAYCFGTEEKNCCVRKLYIDFRQDLKWKWIHEPRGYWAHLCTGACPYIWSSDTQYSKVLALYNQHNPGASAAPCCAPDTLDPLTIVYYVGRKAKVEQLSNMIVRSCKCS